MVLYESSKPNYFVSLHEASPPNDSTRVMWGHAKAAIYDPRSLMLNPINTVVFMPFEVLLMHSKSHSFYMAILQ